MNRNFSHFTVGKSVAVTFGMVFTFMLLVQVPFGSFPVNGFGIAEASSKYGILGRRAPELMPANWMDEDGRATSPVRLGDLKGSVVYLYLFQDWCPGCQSHGFPTLKKLTDAFKDHKRVKFLAVQTVFEGHRFNTGDKLRKNQLKFDLKIPMAHDPGKDRPNGVPRTMRDYRSGGTPWTVVIDPLGRVVYNQFHIDPDKAVELINRLLEKHPG